MAGVGKSQGPVVDTSHEKVSRATPETSEALRQQELHFDQLISGIADYAIFLLDPDGRVKTWNKGAERIKGYLPREIIGQHLSVFYTAEDSKAGWPDKVLRIARETGRFEADAWRVRKDGTRFYANVVIDALRSDDGRLLGFAKITRDMTARKAIEEQLAHAQKMDAIGQLTGGVAHDFNNILTIILGNLDIISRESTDPRRVREAAAQASKGAQRAATLTRQLLAFSRRQPLNPKPLDVNGVVASAISLIRPSLGEQIIIETNLADDLWLAEIDPHQIENALLNLAINARDAMPHGGTLTIETANWNADQADCAESGGEMTAGRYVQISVTDTGTGMSRDVFKRAFEPFFTTKPVGEGTGLGLSQVYGFVRQSDGHIRLHSEVGHGTTVKMYFPRTLDRAAPDVAAAHLVHKGTETILLVEDEPGVRLYGAQTLRELGFTVLEAGDGVAALSILRKHPHVDLLFTDVGLPGLNGRQLAEQARELRPHIPVLFTTGYAKDAVVHQGRLDSGVHLLAKPYTREELVKRIRDVLDGPKHSSDRMKAALVVEDEPLLREVVGYVLKTFGFRAIEVSSIAEAYATALTTTFDLAVVDQELGDGSGIDVIHRLRERSPKLPVILASGHAPDLAALGLSRTRAMTVALNKPYSLQGLEAALRELGLERTLVSIASDT